MFRLFCIIIGYFTGCVQTAYYIGKIFANIDIREHGSGNAGTTNITRTLGAKAGALTFFADVLKTVLVYIGCSLLFKGSGSFYTYAGEGGNGLLPGIYGGLGIILGHNFPFQLKFKGGKGVAATLAIFICINLKVALTSFGIGIVILFLSKTISMASILTPIIFTTLSVLSVFAAFTIEENISIAIMMLMVIIRHRGNIKRLLNGTESKFTVKSVKKG